MARTKAKPTRKPRATNRGKVKAEQPRDGDSLIIIPRASSGIRVTQDNALQFSAVWACVGVISESIASMPWNVIKRTASGQREVASDHPVDWLLHTQPNPEMTAFTFKELLVSWALTWGNGYAEIERDRAGRVMWLWPICPDRVRVGRADNDEIYYEIHNRTREPSYVHRDDMFHLHGRGYDGLVGYSVVALAARTIGYAFDLEAEGDSFSVNDSTPGGFIKHPGVMTKPAQEKFRESIQKVHGGPRNKGKLMILEEKMEYQAIGLPKSDSQFLENRKFQVTEICRWFRVPPHKIADLDRSTNNNIEHQGVEFVTDCLLPWSMRTEQEANWKLFGRQQQGVYATKINLNALMRGDSAARAAYYTALRNLGATNADEIRKLEDMNEIGEEGGGKKYLVGVNLTTLEKVGEQPVQSAQAPGQPPQEGDDPAQADDDAPQPGSNGAQPKPSPLDAWFLEAATNIANRERHRATDAAKRHAGDSEGFGGWLDTFFAEHRNYAMRTLLAPAKAVAGDSDELNVALGLCVDRHLGERRDVLTRCFADGAEEVPTAPDVLATTAHKTAMAASDWNRKLLEVCE